MPSSYTTSLRLTLPATGELAGQWGTTVNTGITELLDSAVAGTTTISTWGGAGVAYTLSNNSGTADEARRMFIVATGTPGEAKNVICPAVSKFYVFRNDTTGGFALTLKTPSGTGIAVPAGQYKFLYCNGTDVVEAFNSAGALTLSGALSVGGTATFAANPTLNAGTANGVTYLNGSKVLTSGTALAFNGTTLSVTGNVSSSNAGNENYFLSDGSTRSSLQQNSNVLYYNVNDNSATSGSFIWRNTNAFSELMRLTSTGLGIGTSSPGAKLDVVGTAAISGAVTLSGGTANGVLYLNGSKVATSGTALTFDGAGGLAVNSGSANGSVSATSTGNTAALESRHDISYSRVTSSAHLLDIATLSNQPILFTVNSSEQMRLTSTGLGIGTSSPARKLQVNSGEAVAARFTRSGGTVANNSLEWFDGTNGWYAGVSGSNFFGIAYNSSGAIDSAALRLDSSGNLGLGVTPSAWGSGKALEIGSGGNGIWSGSGYTSLLQNTAFTSGAYRYVTSQTAARFDIETNVFKWFTAPSGTAGNAISFTQAMTLDASGNLGVGQTSPGVNGIDILKSGGTATYVRTSDGTYTMLSGVAPALGGGLVGTTTNAPLLFYANNTERARITSDGNLALGGTGANPSGLGGRSFAINTTGTNYGGLELSRDGNYIGALRIKDAGADNNLVLINNTANSLIFGTSNTERARITSGGDFGIGNTNPLYRLTVDKDTTSALALFTNSNASAPNGAYIDFSASSPNNATQYFLYCEDSTAQRATIRSNGGLANYSGNDVNLSDRREKTNFAPAKDYLDTICAIPVQTFNYIDQSEDDPGLTLGVVAQDVQAVAPELVMESNWGTEDNPKMRLSIYQTDLQYALMKCVQELKAELDSVKAELATLKGQP